MEIKEIDPFDPEKMGQARSIFTSYFLDLYKDISSEMIGIANVPLYLEEIFSKTESALKEGKLRAFFAYVDDGPMGFSTAGLLEDPSILLVRTLPVHLSYKTQEAEIRNAFFVYFRKQFPMAKQIVMMVRKANVHHGSLCLNGGFKKEMGLFASSAYLKTTYSSDLYDPYLLIY